MTSADHPVIEAFRAQVRWARDLQAPFTTGLLEHVVGALRRGDPAVAPLLEWPGQPLSDNLPARLTGALHALVLDGSAPALAGRYPRPGAPAVADDALWREAAHALLAHAPRVQRFLASPPQTNEVARSAVLLGGFHAVAGRFRLPLQLLELGASAGLNLLWDRYRYTLGAATWGDPQARPHLQPDWQGGTPDLSAPIAVAGRRGCDLQPVDVNDSQDALRLRAYVWAEHADRRQRLEQALERARGADIRVDRASAEIWLERQLACPAEGVARIVYHSVFWQYLPSPIRARLRGLIEAAGRGATAANPLAWLRFEFARAGQRADLLLTCWPGGDTRLLAHADGHVRGVQWLGPEGMPVSTTMYGSKEEL